MDGMGIFLLASGLTNMFAAYIHGRQRRQIKRLQMENTLLHIESSHFHTVFEALNQKQGINQDEEARS